MISEMDLPFTVFLVYNTKRKSTSRRVLLKSNDGPAHHNSHGMTARLSRG
jgi:hypothetical protein